MSGAHWSWSWPSCATTLRNWHVNFFHEYECKRSALYFRRKMCFRWDSLRSIYLDVGCSKCGQTPHLVVGTEIQTCRNFKASSCSHHLFLVSWCFLWVNDDLQRHYRPQGILCSLATFAGNFDLLLHKNLLQATISRSPSTRPCPSRTIERRREFAEHSKIQEVRFKCFVSATGISFLLCSLEHCLCVICQRNNDRKLCGMARCRESDRL